MNGISCRETYQHILKTAAAETHVNIMARYDARNPGALRSLLDQGVELKRFPDEIMAAGRTASFELYEELAAADATYNKNLHGLERVPRKLKPLVFCCGVELY